MRWWIAIVCLLACPAWADEPLTLVGAGGESVAVLPAPGQTVLLHFWATWCPTCGDDIAALQRAAASCPVERLRVVLVDVDEGEAEIARFVERYGIELPLLRDPEGKVFREVGGRGLPMNLVWSKGERTTDIAPRSEAEWRKHLDALGCGASSRTR